MLYLSIETVLDAHNRILDQYGGLHGVYNIGLLESVLQHIQYDTYYPTSLDKLSHLFFDIIKFHCFNDGNKRTAVFSFFLSF